LLRQARIGFFGHNFNGITAADFDLSLLRRKMGAEVFSFDVSELLKVMEGFDAASESYQKMEARVLSKLQGTTGEFLDKIVRMCLGLSQYIHDFGLDALDVRCHTELSQTFGLAACLPLSILGDDLPCSCEADLPVMLTQLVLSLLSGGKISGYVDLRSFHEDGMDVGACGFAPCGMTGGKATVSGPEAPENGAPAGYLTNKSGFNEGKLTMARLLKYPGGELKLHLTGAVALKEEELLQEQFCPYYPMAKIVPDVSMERFMQYVGANHYALVYADVEAAAQYLCKYLDIQLVN
jgi:L-fucose isomerase-like protein